VKQHTLHRVLIAFLLLAAPVAPCFSHELQTRHATVVYQQEDQLLRFNHRISVTSFSRHKKDARAITVSDEVRSKLDSIIEKIEVLLHVYPGDLKFNVLLTTAADVQRHYKDYYGIDNEYIAFYCRQNRTVFISVDDVNEYVLAHELTHVVIDQYFRDPPSATMQEVLAQFVETHIEF